MRLGPSVVLGESSEFKLTPDQRLSAYLVLVWIDLQVGRRFDGNASFGSGAMACSPFADRGPLSSGSTSISRFKGAEKKERL